MDNNSISMEDAADAFHELNEEDFIEAVKAMLERRMRIYPIAQRHMFRDDVCNAIKSL